MARARKRHAQQARNQGELRVQLVPFFPDYRDANPHLFPSVASARWHLTLYRKRYIKAGALVKVNRQLLVDPPKFETELRAIGAEDAAKAATAGA